MTNRRLALATWGIAILLTGLWWPLSYRYSTGFTASTSAAPSPRSPGLGSRSERGIAIISGVGKIIFYLSWNSAFTRRGFFFEPVMPHEFPHPWLGFQRDGGRLWVSFPIALIFSLVVMAAGLHLLHTRRKPTD